VHDQPGSIANTILTNTEADETRSLKALKSDNAPVPGHLWNHVIVTASDPLYTEKVSALNQFCLSALWWWKKCLLKEFVTWYKTKHSSGGPTSKSSLVDLEAGRDCITRASNSSWWAWDDGSRPHFWRWSASYQSIVRDGLQLWLQGPLPQWQVPQ
jgi:hypothetical protein